MYFPEKKNPDSSDIYTSEGKNCAAENYPFRITCDFIIVKESTEFLHNNFTRELPFFSIDWF